MNNFMKNCSSVDPVLLWQFVIAYTSQKIPNYKVTFSPIFANDLHQFSPFEYPKKTLF